MSSRRPPVASDAPVAIEAEDLSKTYRIWDRPSSRLAVPTLEALSELFPRDSRPARALSGRALRHYRDFHALQNVSFRLHRGESMGIIGRNGSGKSTLLQIITGTLRPTRGNFALRGRVAALLELGSGFNPDFTGEENVFLNASILGLTRKETEERFDAIAAFADIGDFIDQPVKTYSSGMQVRLAFAVAAHVDPEIFIVDEALSVGDARFQLKCARTIDRLIERGVTLLFVSHDMNMVKRLCSQALLLEQGRLIYCGQPNDTANLYSKLLADGGSVEALAPAIQALKERDAAAETFAPPAPSAAWETIPAIIPESPAPEPNQIESTEFATLRQRVKALEVQLAAAPESHDWQRRVEEMLRSERQHRELTGEEFQYGGELGRITAFQMLDAEGEPRSWFTTGTSIEVRMVVEAYSDVPEPIFAMTVKDPNGQEIYGTNTVFSRQNAPSMRTGDRWSVRFVFPVNLIAGQYFLSLGFTQFVGEELVILHRRYDAIKFSVYGVDRCFGIANCYAQILVENA